MPSDSVGDFWPTCPAEWSPESAIKTANGMLDRHGPSEALARALGYVTAYWEGTWGRRHWNIVADLIAGQTNDDEVLAKYATAPAGGWPSNPSLGRDVKPAPIAGKDPEQGSLF